MILCKFNFKLEFSSLFEADHRKRFNSAHDRTPISLLEQTSLRRSTESCGDTHKKRLFKIYKWSAESLNSMCDLTSAANLVNLLTD